MRPLDGIKVLQLPGNLATQAAGSQLTQLGAKVVQELDDAVDIVLVDHRNRSKHHFDEASARALNPKLIIGIVYGLGTTGPGRDRECDDLLAQSVSGLVHLTGNQDDPPTPFAIPIAELLAGTHLVQGVLAALYRREITGHGAKVEVSLLESLLDFQFEVLTTHFADGGRLPQRSKQYNAHAYLSAPYGIYPTQDGYLALGMANVSELGKKMGSQVIAQHTDSNQWFIQRDLIQSQIADHLKTKSTTQWLELLEPQDVWCAEVMTIEKLKTLPGYAALKIDASHGPIRIDENEESAVKTAKKSVPVADSLKQSNLPLEGLVVIDFSQFLSGPCASLRLADLGARVIKIEKPIIGDICRQLYVSDTRLDGESTTFHAINRNKESYVADLKTPAGLEEVKKLLANADVVIHNFRPGVFERLGLGFEQVKQINSQIIYAAISGYGDKGPWRDKPGQDLLVQAISGLAYQAGDKPVAMGLSVVDQMAGMYLVQGILSLLYRKTHTQLGGRVDVSMLETALDLQIGSSKSEKITQPMNWMDLQASDIYQTLEMTQLVRRRNGTTYRTTRCPIVMDGKKLLSGKGSPDLGEDTEGIKRAGLRG